MAQHAIPTTNTDSSATSLNASELARENDQFAGTYGLSCNNAQAGFLPAFRNDATGEVALARFADGRMAPMHLLVALPEAWAAARNARGQICAVVRSVVAGFVRDGQFYTRAEATAVSK